MFKFGDIVRYKKEYLFSVGDSLGVFLWPVISPHTNKPLKDTAKIWFKNRDSLWQGSPSKLEMVIESK